MVWLERSQDPHHTVFFLTWGGYHFDKVADFAQKKREIGSSNKATLHGWLGTILKWLNVFPTQVDQHFPWKCDKGVLMFEILAMRDGKWQMNKNLQKNLSETCQCQMRSPWHCHWPYWLACIRVGSFADVVWSSALKFQKSDNILIRSASLHPISSFAF